MSKAGSTGDVKIAQSAPAVTYEDESVKAAGENTRRRIRAANSRDNSNKFWTSLLTNTNSGGKQKTTLG